MPVTPLHFGVLAPVNHFFANKVSNVSFILANLWIDQPAIDSVLTGTPFPPHDAYHSFIAVGIILLALGGPGCRYPKWFWGVALGCYSHILLDGMVHEDMEPFAPFIKGNPLYLGILDPLSWFLLLPTGWFIAQCVSGIRGWIQQYLALRRTGSSLAQK